MALALNLLDWRWKSRQEQESYAKSLLSSAERKSSLGVARSIEASSCTLFWKLVISLRKSADLATFLHHFSWQSYGWCVCVRSKVPPMGVGIKPKRSFFSFKKHVSSNIVWGSAFLLCHGLEIATVGNNSLRIGWMYSNGTIIRLCVQPVTIIDDYCLKEQYFKVA